VVDDTSLPVGFMGALTVAMRFLVLLFSRIDEPTPTTTRVIPEQSFERPEEVYC
jgi:hypothetical protein